MGENIVITIARQYGSGGKTIGAMLAKELGINCYSREILKMASEESGINEGLFGMSDEKIKKAPWFKILNRPYDGELLTPEDRDFVSDDNLFNYQAKVIRDLAEKESCVIVGRCADYVLKENPNVVSVFIHADKKFCLERALERNSMEVIPFSFNTAFPLFGSDTIIRSIPYSEVSARLNATILISFPASTESTSSRRPSLFSRKTDNC